LNNIDILLTMKNSIFVSNKSFKMKKIILFQLFILITVTIYAQFQEHIVTTNTKVNSVYSIDLDGDGDMDIISGNRQNNQLMWHENTNGLGEFGVENIIYNVPSSLYNVNSVIASDVDQDGDMDILMVSTETDYSTVDVVKNIDGFGTFITFDSHSIQSGGAQSVYANDIDNDGDIDWVASTSPNKFNDAKLIWFENDSSGNSIEHVIAEVHMTTIQIVDVNNDGYLDILAGSMYSDSRIVWFENIDGLGNFSAQQIISTNVNGVSSVYAKDLDNDGDLDVISSSFFDDKIAWYKNIDGLGNFSTQQIISTNAEGASSVFAIDLDQDGDEDIVSASTNDNKIAWYENIDGQGSFSSQKIISLNANGVRFIHSSDIDNDGDMDIISANSNENKIAWYENLGTLSLNQNTLLDFSIYPNPTKNILTINSNTTISHIEIYNELGVAVLSNFYKNNIDISTLDQGLYFIKVKDEKGISGIQKLIKK